MSRISNRDSVYRRVHAPAFSVSHGPASGREVPMRSQHARPFSRRRFLSRLTLVGTAGLLGLCPGRGAAEPPPETTTLRLVRNPGICVAAEYVAEELLHGEGFTEVQYVQQAVDAEKGPALAAGAV